MNGGSIVGCKANDNGGGVKVDCEDTKGSRFTMNGGAIIGCVAKGHGGGVETQANGVGNELHGAFIMDGGVIEHCVANQYGGICCSGSFTMNGGTIRYCRATEETAPAEQKDGVYLAGRGQNILNGAIISEDAVDTQYVFAPAPVTIGADADIRANMYLNGYTIALADGVTSKTIYGKITNGRYADGLATVTYQVNGADYATQIVRSGSEASRPADPTVPEGQTFDGWYKADGTKWDFTTALTEDIVLAGWLYVPVANEAELIAAMQDDTVGMIRLTDDITLTTRTMSIIIRDGRQLILDLNGRVLDMGENPICVGGDTVGIMTIMDSRPDAPHKFTPNADGLWVWDETGGTETVLGGVITGSTGSSSSAICVGGSGGNVIMNGGNIVGHKTGGSIGGAVCITGGGRFTMNGGNIIGCTAEDGGGVCVLVGTFELAGGVIKNCKAVRGGAVRAGNKDGTFTMTGGEIKNCTADLGGAIYLNGGKMNANGGTVSGTVMLDTKTNNGITSKGIIQGSGSTATLFNGAVTSYGEIKHGTFSGTVTLGNSSQVGTITGGTFNGPVTTASEGEAEISGGVFNKTVTINRGRITKGTFNKDVVVDNALVSYSCTTLTGGTYNGLIINKSAYTTFAGAHSPLGIVETKPSSRYSNDRYRTVTFDLAGGEMDYPVRYFFDDGNISDQIVPDFRAGYFFDGWYNGENKWNYSDTVGEDDLTLTAHWTACDHSGHTGEKPDCTTSVICTECGGTIAALGHDFSVEQHDDDRHWKKCSRCDIIDGEEPHDWDTGTVTIPATCMVSGEKTYICTECGFEKTESIQASGHDWEQEWRHDAAHHWHECRNSCCDVKNDDPMKDGYGEHTGGTATCTVEAVCEACGNPYGALDAKNHTNLVHIPAKTATADAEGNIEYWYCKDCGKYYSDAAATKELTKAETVIRKLPKTPQTGDGADLMLWLALLTISGGAVIGAMAAGRKRRSNKKNSNR